MQYLFGEFRHKIDAKNRLSLPSDFRKELPDVLMVSQSPKKDEDCLYVYDIDGFGEWVASLFESDGGFSPSNSQHVARQRALHSRAKRVEPDSAGRIGLTADMRASANLEKDVVIVGNGNHIEIWSEKAWDEFINNVDLDGMYS